MKPSKERKSLITISAVASLNDAKKGMQLQSYFSYQVVLLFVCFCLLVSVMENCRAQISSRDDCRVLLRLQTQSDCAVQSEG